MLDWKWHHFEWTLKQTFKHNWLKIVYAIALNCNFLLEDHATKIRDFFLQLPGKGLTACQNLWFFLQLTEENLYFYSTFTWQKLTIFPWSFNANLLSFDENLQFFFPTTIWQESPPPLLHSPMDLQNLLFSCWLFDVNHNFFLRPINENHKVDILN